MVSLDVSESGCGIKACESFWKKQTGQEEITAGCTVPAPALFGSDTDVFETEDLAGERTGFSVSVGDSTAESKESTNSVLCFIYRIKGIGCYQPFVLLPIPYLIDPQYSLSSCNRTRSREGTMPDRFDPMSKRPKAQNETSQGSRMTSLTDHRARKTLYIIFQALYKRVIKLG